MRETILEKEFPSFQIFAGCLINDEKQLITGMFGHVKKDGEECSCQDDRVSFVSWLQ